MQIFLPRYQHYSLCLWAVVRQVSGAGNTDKTQKETMRRGSEMQNATRSQITHHQLSVPASKSNTSDFEAASELKHGNRSDRDIRQPHTGIYAIRSRSNFFSVFISNEIEENDIFATEYVVMDESSSSFKTSGEGALTTCKSSWIRTINRRPRLLHLQC